MSSLLRYIRSKFYQEPDEFSIEQFAVFDEGNRGGFPSDVVAFDYHNGCVVIGTMSGDVTFYGFRGASWSINLNKEGHEKLRIEHIFFIAQNTVLVLCHGFLIIPLQIQDGKISRKEDHQFPENREQQRTKWSITHVQKLSDDSYALVFCINSTIYRIKHKTLKLEILIPPDDLKRLESDLTSITSLPDKPNLLMLLTESGKVGIFNESKFIAIFELKNFEDEAIQKIYWSSEKKKNHGYGVSCNNKYTKWEFTSGKDNLINAQEINVYSTHQFGPYPCHQVRHFNVCPNSSSKKSKEDILVYQGGKSSGKYDDRDLVTVVRGDNAEKLELSSEIIGIAAVDGGYDGSNKKGVILICTKCEIIGLDLETEGLQMMQPKHFLSINNSTPTTHARAIDIDENVWNRLETASKVYWESNQMSSRDWPLFFQKKIVTEANHQRAAYRQVYISGHSNGNICIWSTGGVGMSLLLVISTSLEFDNGSLFDTEGDAYYSTEEKLENPVRKVGLYDPFDDEEEMRITRVHLDPKSGFVIGTNRGGYVLMYELCESTRTLSCWEPLPVSCNNSPPDNRKKALKPRKQLLDYQPGYQIRLKNESELPLVFSMHPSHRVTDIVYLHKYHCLVVGSNFGVVMLDVNHGYLVYANSFTDDQDSNTIHPNQFNRFRSLKKSLRKTFRRKKKTSDNNQVIDTGFDRLDEHEYPRRVEEFEEAFMERAIEAREDLGALACYSENSKGTVSCIRMIRFPVVDDKNVDDVIAVGLHEGSVHFYSINEHDVGLRMTFKAEHIKKLSIPHKQPVLCVDITNEEGYFSASTRIVVITEEQVRVYNCQPMVKRDGYKITALEGLKIKNGIVARILNKKNSNNFESFILLLANDGSLRIHSVQKPSLFETRKFIDPMDVMALNSSCLSRDGDVAYLIKSSELQRSTVNLNFRGWETHKS